MGRREGSGFGVRGSRFVVLLVGSVMGLWSLGIPACAEESLEARRARVEEMDPTDKAQLLRRLESFQMMTADQQERLRRVHEEIERDAQAAELREVMQRYYEWLKTLKPYQKAELAELSPRERVERIKRIQQEQARRDAKRSGGGEVARVERLKRLLQEQIPKMGKRLSPEEVEALLHWMEQYAASHAAQLIDELPAGQQAELRRQWARVKDPDRRREIVAAIWLRVQATSPGKLPVLTSAELTELRKRLTPPTRQRMDALSEPEQRRIVLFWFRLMLLNYTASHHLARLPNEVSDEELGEFLEHQLNPGARDWLLGLPPEEMQRELWAQYLRSQMLESATPNRPGAAKPAGGAKLQRPGGKKAGTGPVPRPMPIPGGKHPGKREAGKANNGPLSQGDGK